MLIPNKIKQIYWEYYQKDSIPKGVKMVNVCLCGCNRLTKENKRGNPNRFIHGHNGKLWINKQRPKEIGIKISKTKKGVSFPHIGRHQLNHKLFYCKCGCGTPLLYDSSKRFNYKLNKPKQYVLGHNPIPFYSTSIERVITTELFLRNIDFNMQYCIKSKLKKFIKVDIFIEPNIIIHCDGCYFHNCSICGFNNYKFTDKIYVEHLTDNELEQKGYIVLRFWEHDIHKDVLGICDFIQNITQKGIL